jgi:hypothetical protein
MTTRKTAQTVHTELKIHEKMCMERWHTIFKKTDALQTTVDSMKIWLLGGLTTIVGSLITLIVKTSI